MDRHRTLAPLLTRLASGKCSHVQAMATNNCRLGSTTAGSVFGDTWPAEFGRRPSYGRVPHAHLLVAETPALRGLSLPQSSIHAAVARRSLQRQLRAPGRQMPGVGAG